MFAAVELRTANPLLDIGLLRRRVLVGIVLAMFAAQFIINGYLIYVATYFQHVLGFSPLLAALAIVPSVITQPIFNIAAGRLTDRVGPRGPATAGYLLTAVAFAWIALTVDDDTCLLLLPGLLLLGVSIAPMFTSLLTGLSNAVAADERGDANALVLTVRWIGAAAGTMALGVIVYAGGTVVTDASPYAQLSWSCPEQLSSEHSRARCCFAMMGAVRALVISDTHFGAWTGRDLLREEQFLERLAPQLEGIDELVFLGDLFDFLFGSVGEAVDASAGCST